jgi:CRP/FNR family transcriptional regulator
MFDATTSKLTAVTEVPSDSATLGGMSLEELRTHVPAARRKLRAGQCLHRAGQPFHALYLVTSGFLKTSIIAADGREQITGFCMRGDLMGVESIGMEAYAGDAIALDTSVVWELSYPAVLNACALIPQLHAQLTRALAAQIRSTHSWMLALGTLSAEQRVAAFLLDVAARHAALGFSARQFVLRMSRADMGSFLALKHETVTRALSALSAQGCVSVKWREVQILDARRLHAIARDGDSGGVDTKASRELRPPSRPAYRGDHQVLAAA